MTVLERLELFEEFLKEQREAIDRCLKALRRGR